MFYYFIQGLYIKKNFEEIFQYLSSSKYDKFLAFNYIFKAEKYYWLGKIASVKKFKGMRKDIEYFEDAYRLLDDIEITELTWKVTFALSEVFLKRGNLNKAADFMFLTKEIINKFGNQISDLELRSAFYNETERKDTLEKLSRWEILVK